MNRKLGKIAVMVLLVLLAGAVTGCGKTEIDVMENLEVEFNGVDGYGTARLVNEYDWEDVAYEAIGGDDSEDISLLRDMMKIEGAVSFELYPNEDLSNGDEVTVRAVVDNEAVGEYKIKFKAGEKKFTVDGLKELEQIDLFENVDVEFQGIAPYVTASINRGNSDRDIYVNYSIDKDKNLAVGDSVTVTAEYREDLLLEKGYVAGNSTKEYVVPDSDKYVTQLAEIPEDTINKMNKQFEDALRADIAKNWAENESLKSVDYAGCYLLTAKDGMNVRDKNVFYGVYKIEVDNTENEFFYYSYCMFKNIIILKDGTCSVDLTDYKMPSGSSWIFGKVSGEAFYKGNYWYVGYEEIDSLFNNCVTKNIEQYEYESNIIEE